ncbi:hypothetical protein AAF712_011730 [Marasmius tenuissimus]|uniref:F-box domain-containing protein n=1 Tax=Marasmius tenuissimus TaxID=585030 RepID=A0ABR2ZIM5_9AGAR
MNHRYIQDAQDVIDQLETDVGLLESQIHCLRTCQAALKRDILQYASLDSPIRKLPVEILRLIFGFVSGRSNFGHWVLCPWTSMVFCLSSVCSRWREVSLNSPELWASIGFSVNEERALKPVSISLSRSRNYPLSVYISGSGEKGPESFQVLLALLYQHCDRLCHLDLTDLAWDIIEDFMKPLNDTPLLESVVCMGDLAEIVLAKLITNAPRLQDIEYSIAQDPYLSDYVPPDTTRYLDMGYDRRPDVQMALQVLHRASQLHSMFLHWMVDDADTIDPHEAPDEPLKDVRSAISSLSIDLSGPKGSFPLICDLFRNISLPCLQDLRVCLDPPYRLDYKKGSKCFGTWPRDTLHSFLERSDCTLTTLVLEGMPLSESEVTGLLKYTPFLRTLILCELWATDKYVEDLVRGHSWRPASANPKFKCQTVTKSFLRRLEASNITTDAFATAQHPLVPRLRTLKLGVQSHFDGDEVFVDLCKSRWEQGDGNTSLNRVERLRTAVLHVLGRELVKRVYEPLKRFDREGMMISVFGNGERAI